MTSPAPVIAVIGTRPEAIKMAPVLRALAAREMKCTLICTGQHPTLDLAGCGVEQPADAWLPLDLERLGEHPDAMCHRIEALVADRLARDPPRMVIVQGDTNSALGAARAAHRLRSPVAHVEAGLRTHDPRDPGPRSATVSRSMRSPNCCSRQPPPLVPTCSAKACPAK